MKKLIVALALCAGPVAFAQLTQQPGDSIREAQREKEQGIDATEVGPKLKETAKDIAGIQTESEGTFKVEQAFTLRGTLKDKTLEGVTIERQGLPAADLDIRDETLVWLDGKKVKADALPEGAQVRAKFQLEGQDIVAVELRATSAKPQKKEKMKRDTRPGDATGGSGPMEVPEELEEPLE